MELLWAITKMIQYLVLGPVWWLSTYFASFLYPLEGDSNQDILALIFSTFIVIGMCFGLTVWLQG